MNTLSQQSLQGIGMDADWAASSSSSSHFTLQKPAQTDEPPHLAQTTALSQQVLSSSCHIACNRRLISAGTVSWSAKIEKRKALKGSS